MDTFVSFAHQTQDSVTDLSHPTTFSTHPHQCDSFIHTANCLCPSAQQSLEDLLNVEEIWHCDVCFFTNSGTHSTCMLCWRDREAFASWTYADEPVSDDSEDGFLENFLNKTNNLQMNNCRASSPTVDNNKHCSSESAFIVPYGGSSSPDYNGSDTEMTQPPAGASPSPTASSSCSMSLETLTAAPSCNINGDNKLINHEYSFDLDEEEDHELQLLISSSNGPFRCPQDGCKSVLDNVLDMKVHMAQHKWGVDKVHVGECGRLFYHCLTPDCDKSFMDRKLLRKHMLSHREKMFACHYPDCERKFYERAKLKRHFLVHTGEKPFVCPYEDWYVYNRLCIRTIVICFANHLYY
jgi:hypothetical protein